MMAMAMPLAPFWGVLAERYSRRPIILRAYILLAAALFIAAWAEDVRWLIVARLLMGLCSGAGGVIIATQAMITPANRLGSAIATVQASQPIAASLGPPMGALAIPFIGLRGLFMVDAVVTLLRRAGARAADARAVRPGEARLGAGPHRRGVRPGLEDAADSLELLQRLPDARRHLGGRRLPAASGSPSSPRIRPPRSAGSSASTAC